jgi:hypothetical protein
MYRCHGWTPALLLTVLFAMQSTLCNAEPPKIGVAASIRPNAEGVIGANSRTLSSGSELYANETVRTGNVGRANLIFIDNTNLTVGPTSEVLLDEFVYDPIGSSGRVVMQATRGAFRFDTGKQDHSAYQLKTPYGTAAPAQSHVPLYAYAPTDQRSSANNAFAQAVGRGAGTVVSVEVRDPKKPKERGECDVTVTVESGEGEFTTPDQKRHRVRQGEKICVSDGKVSYSTAEGPPPPGGPPSPPGGGGVTPPVIPPVISPTRPRAPG